MWAHRRESVTHADEGGGTGRTGGTVGGGKALRGEEKRTDQRNSIKGRASAAISSTAARYPRNDDQAPQGSIRKNGRTQGAQQSGSLTPQGREVVATPIRLPHAHPRRDRPSNENSRATLLPTLTVGVPRLHDHTLPARKPALFTNAAASRPLPPLAPQLASPTYGGA